jgi:hypothetical protein
MTAVPPPRLPVLDLCCCHRCSRDLVYQPGILQQLRARGVPTYCPRCQKIVDAEQAARPVVPRMRCVHVDYQAGPFSDLFVKAVDGDRVTVGVLGLGTGVLPAYLTRWWPPIMHGRLTFSRGELLMKGI